MAEGGAVAEMAGVVIDKKKKTMVAKIMYALILAGLELNVGLIE